MPRGSRYAEVKQTLEAVRAVKRMEFLIESARIEAIFEFPYPSQRVAFDRFLRLDKVRVEDMCALVKKFEPHAVLRVATGANVSVGNHLPPLGGPAVGYALTELLERAAQPNADAWELHCAYEQLHPFTDCNGRSGRMLWAWMMMRRYGESGTFSMPFLHRFYYQTLSAYHKAGRNVTEDA